VNSVTAFAGVQRKQNAANISPVMNAREYTIVVSFFAVTD